MLLKEIINQSVYGTIGYIANQDDIELIESYILYNLPVLKEFKQVVVATNYKDLDLVELNIQLWKKYFPTCVLLHSNINRGHQIGTTDLDNMLFEYCKHNRVQWLCKSANDTVMLSDILNTTVEEADFYYLTGIGWAGVRDYAFDYERIMLDLFYPQTNFYIINIGKADCLIPQEELLEAHSIWDSYEPNTVSIQHLIDDFCCERILQRCVLRNKLSKQHIIENSIYRRLLEIIDKYQIHDGSHKNIMVNGICHFHYPNNQIILV